jgi:hypothetical protein
VLLLGDKGYPQKSHRFTHPTAVISHDPGLDELGLKRLVEVLHEGLFVAGMHAGSRGRNLARLPTDIGQNLTDRAPFTHRVGRRQP